MADAIDYSQLASDLSSYFRKFKQGLRSQVQYGFVGDTGPMGLDQRLLVIPGITDELEMGSVTVDDYLRQYNGADTTTFRPVNSAVNLAARKLKMRPFKGDLLFLDDKINKTFLMWQAKMEAINQGRSSDKVMSFIDYLFMEVIIKKALRSLRKVTYQGVWNANGAGWTTGPFNYASANIVDGIEALIAAEIAGTGPSGAVTITPHAYNSSNNIVTEVEAMFDTLTSEQKRADNLVVGLREDIYSKWFRANRFSLGRTADFDSQTYTIDGYPNARVLPEPDLATYKAVAYEKNNIILSVTMDGPNATDWEFQRFERTTKCMLNGEVGVQFETVNPGEFVNVAVMS